MKTAEGVFYNHGVELTEGGIYGKQSYLQVARDRKLGLPSLYPLMWVNFAAFGIALLTQENAEQRLLKLLSTQRSVRLDCFNTVSLLWRTMLENFSLLHEELSFFLMAVMLNVVKVS